jgi:sugar/nucleoside kinase (ribokinase family)
VVAIGENSIDLVAELDRHPTANSKQPLRGFFHLPGGEAASAAVGLARLGWRVGYVGKFGDDDFGRAGRERLEAEGVDISRVSIVPNVSSRLAIILADRDAGNRTVLWQRDPALSLEPADLPDDVLASTRVVLVGSDDVPAMTEAARRARRAGARTIGDIERVHDGTRDLLAALDVIVMAASFPAAFTGQMNRRKAMRQIAETSGASIVCVTLGEKGCVALVGHEEIQMPAFTVDVVDTTGAGDLFRAGFIARWLMEPAGPPVAELLRYANAVGGLNCRGVGAWTAAPRRSEVEALLKS